MRSFSIIFFLLYSIILSGQTNYAKEADYKAFLKTKTLVVLENKLLSSYNETIRKVVEQIWTITPYEFITDKEFEIKKHNKNFHLNKKEVENLKN